MQAIPSLLAGATPGVDISYALTWPPCCKASASACWSRCCFRSFRLLDVRT
jgi:hypothetical protein